MVSQLKYGGSRGGVLLILGAEPMLIFRDLASEGRSLTVIWAVFWKQRQEMVSKGNPNSSWIPTEKEVGSHCLTGEGATYSC